MTKLETAIILALGTCLLLLMYQVNALIETFEEPVQVTEVLNTPVNQLELTRKHQRIFTNMVNHGVNTIKEQPA